jgi:hypothetical protein
MSDEQHNAADAAADAATGAAVDAHRTGNVEKAAPLFNRATVEHQRAAATEPTDQGQAWRDGSAPLAPMPEAPHIATSKVDSAIAKLNERSDGHSDLVARWGSDFAPNLAYAKAAFAEISTNRPDLIAKFEAAGLGDDPSVIDHLATFGRQQAGMAGDFTIARNHSNEPAFTNRAEPASTRAGPSGNNRGSEETQTELRRLINENPPGSQRYAGPQIQNRIQQLHRMIAGSGSVIGRGGRSV